MSQKNQPYDDKLTLSPPLLGREDDGDFNYEDYMEDLKDSDLSDEQKKEMLEALWYIMSTIVDLGWGMDTVNIVLPELFQQAATGNNSLPENQSNDNNESSILTKPAQDERKAS